MKINVKPKEATSIINSLLGGVVPKIGVQHILVGRSLEVEAFVQSLKEVEDGHSMVKFWIGDFGSGKSFMLHILNTVALKQGFVITSADFTPETRLYSNDGKSLALYRTIMNNLAIQTKLEGGAINTILDKWIEQVMIKVSKENNISFTDMQQDGNHELVKKEIMTTINELTDVGGYDFGYILVKYFEAYSTGNNELKRNALRWLKGEYRTKTEARQDLGVREIVNDQNYYDMLKNFSQLFVHIGYKGFMINLDEAINLYKISTSQMREKNYEKILFMYNDCLQGKVNNFFINFAGTKDFLENERRGLFSYNALKTRLQSNRFETSEVRDFSQPVIKLMPLDHNEIFVLLQKLKDIFNLHYDVEINIEQDDILSFMEDMFNKPGASEFLTPREVIRDFLNILNLLRQNPGLDKKKLISDIEIKDERPTEEFENIEEY